MVLPCPNLKRLIRNVAAVSVLAAHVMTAAPASAQAECADCTERYSELARERRLQVDVDILNPGDPLERSRRERRRTTPELGLEDLYFGRTGWLLISGIVLGLIALVIYQNSAGGLVSFGRKPEDQAKSAKTGMLGEGIASEHESLPRSDAAFLAEIERMTDRRKALQLLSERLLDRAADGAGIRLGRSWTARESLRALPDGFTSLGELRHLNQHAELAWFGGRAVDDGVFADCVGRARMLLKRGFA